MFATLMDLWRNEDGQTLVEYTLMIGLVVMVIWLAVSVFDIPSYLTKIWSDVDSQVVKGAGS